MGGQFAGVQLASARLHQAASGACEQPARIPAVEGHERAYRRLIRFAHAAAEPEEGLLSSRFAI